MDIWNMFNFRKAVEATRKAADAARGTPTVPRLVEWIGGDRVRQDRRPALVDGKPFEPGKSYFGLSLAGLHLHDARRYMVERLPLCICLAEFQLAGRPKAVPFSLGPDTIRQRLQTAQGKGQGDARGGGERDGASAGAEGQEGSPKSGWVELRDVQIVPPTPVSRANVETFFGLYSVPGDDVARTLLNVLGSVSQAVGGALVPALGVAEKVYEGFNTLLGVKEVTPEAEALHGSLLGNSGYLLVTGLPESAAEGKELSVVGGRLRRGDTDQAPLATEFDYCLVAVERHETVVEPTGTAPDLFGPFWAEVVESFGRPDGSPKAAFNRLKQSIYGSPMLIPSDRDALLAGYLLEFDAVTRALGEDKQDGGTRSAAGGNLRGMEAVRKSLVAVPEIYAALTDPLDERTKSETLKRLTAPAEEGKRPPSQVAPIERAAALRSAFGALEPGDVSDVIVRTFY